LKPGGLDPSFVRDKVIQVHLASEVVTVRQVIESLIELAYLGMSQKFAAGDLVTCAGEKAFKSPQTRLSSVGHRVQARLGIDDRGGEIQVICGWTFVGFLNDFHFSSLNCRSTGGWSP
jgi:hypothetical protein